MDPRAVIRAMESMDPETRARWEDVNLRCLTLCIGMLERVNGVSKRLLLSVDDKLMSVETLDP